MNHAAATNARLPKRFGTIIIESNTLTP